MRHSIASAATVLILVGTLSASSVFAQSGVDEFLVEEEDQAKIGQTAMQFLSISLDPRASAMGNAVTAMELNSASTLYNPAALGFMESSIDVNVGHNRWIADIRYLYGTGAMSVGNIGTFGIHIVSVDHGTINTTIRSENQKGYVDTGEITPSATAVGLSYARALTNRFSAGGNVKYVRQNLGSATLASGGESTSIEHGTLAFDFGMLYRTGFRSLKFAVDVRNFASEVQYAEKSSELPLNFRIGVNMDMLDFTDLNQDIHSFILSIDATHPRSYSEEVKVGGEYRFMDMLALRGGYTYPSEIEGINLGTGLRLPIDGYDVNFNYSYTPYDFFNSVHRLGVRMSIE